MELFIMEHKKLWRRRIVRVSVLLCFIYVVLFGGLLSFQWFAFGSSGGEMTAFGNHFDGYSNIRNSQSYAAQWGGQITDEALRRMVGDYQRKDASGIQGELNETDWRIVNAWIGKLWPELEDPSVYDLMISYVKPELLTGFYDRRQRVVGEFLEISGQTGKEREFLLKMNERVRIPFSYQWTEGWSQLLGSIVADLGVVMALFLAIALSSVFAGEWHDNTGPLLLSTKNGWKSAACAKICAGFAFTLELFTALTVCNVFLQLFFMGTAGWDMPIQCIKLIAIAPMNMLQAEIYEYAFTLLGAIGFAGVVMLISSAVKNNFAAVLLSLAAVFLPVTAAEYMPYEIQKALDLLPLAGSATDIFRTNTFHILGGYIWSPYLLLAVPVLLGFLCVPFTIRKWSRRLRA